MIVSTTRPETMLGDVAVIVHPEDARYTDLHGCQLVHPFTNGLIPLLTDAAADMSMGTGMGLVCLKTYVGQDVL